MRSSNGLDIQLVDANTITIDAMSQMFLLGERRGISIFRALNHVS